MIESKENKTKLYVGEKNFTLMKVLIDDRNWQRLRSFYPLSMEEDWPSSCLSSFYGVIYLEEVSFFFLSIL